MERFLRYGCLFSLSLFLYLGTGCGGGAPTGSPGMQGAANPLPNLTSLSPSSIAAGGATFTLTLTGSDFIPTSQVMWNGTPAPTTYESSNLLTAQIPASDVSSVGKSSVTVLNPPPGGGASSAVTFTANTEILYAANLGNAIFAFNINQTSGALTQSASVSPGGNTVENSVLAITPAKTFLYAVNDVVGGINAYATNSSGSLSLVSGSPFPILPSVQPPSVAVEALTIDPTGRFLYAGSGAGFGGVASFSIDGSGTLTATGGPFPTFSQTTGTGGMPVAIAIDPNGTFLYASDQYESVWGFRISPQDGTLTSIPGSPFVAGSQPFGLQVDPSGKFLYVALSNSNGIAAFTIDSASGALTQVPGSPFPTAAIPFTQTYALTMHPSGKFLYAFNFNGNTVAAFTINASNGVLTPIAGSPFAINPNAEGGLIIDPSGKYLYLTIGSSVTSAFVTFNIDQATGVLTPNLQSPVVGAEEPFGLAVASFP